MRPQFRGANASNRKELLISLKTEKITRCEISLKADGKGRKIKEEKTQ